jgi:hypothetical protein
MRILGFFPSGNIGVHMLLEFSFYDVCTMQKSNDTIYPISFSIMTPVQCK